MDNYKIYAIALNYNGYEDTKNCIKSLKTVGYDNLKIVIVDNASIDKSGEKLKEEFKDLEYIESDKNLGYAGGMNLGIKLALKNNAEFILLTNNDIVFTENFLLPLLKTFSSDNRIGIISPKVLYLHDKNSIYSAGGDFRIWWGGSYNPFQGKSSKQFGNNLREITFADGSCLIVKKEVFEKVGYLDEKYFMYFEDLDFSRRVNKHFKIYYTPDSIVYHKTGAGLGWNNFSSLYYYYYTKNRLVFFSTYNFLIKSYAIIFVFFNSFAKTLVLLKTYIFKKTNRLKIKNSLTSLWKGTFTGLKIILNNQN